jgi:hypothetical protein
MARNSRPHRASIAPGKVRTLVKRTALSFIAAAALVACTDQPGQLKTASAPPAAQTAAAAVPAQAPQPSSAIEGTIVETMDSGGYTYMRLETAGGETWVATPQVTVKKGQVVTVVPQMTAEKFESSTLGRTFDRIVFATFQPAGAASAPPAGTAPQMPPMTSPAVNAPMTSAMGTPSDHMRPKVDPGNVNVPKAEGANARTVAEVWSGRAALGGKEVVVRGKVVKFLAGIMGTNFMHVRDGSGSEAGGDNDLTVTTNDVAAVGDIVTLRGIVQVDKDFGAGYRYPVIVEKAAVKK